MIDEKVLLRIAVIASLIGLAALFIISRHIEINDTTIKKIYQGEADPSVVITGKAISVDKISGVTYIVLSEQSIMDVVVFSDVGSVQPGDDIRITGKIDEYKGKEQIVADVIEII